MGKAAETKKHIIAKASSIMNVKGISGTSVEEILDSAKVARGCLYGHFRTKEELAVACADYMLETLKEERVSRMGNPTSARDKLFNYLTGHKHAFKTPIAGGCPILNLSTEVDDTNPVINKMVKRNIDSYLTLFTGLLQEGIENEEFSEELQPEEFALKIFTSIEGALMVCQVRNSTKPMIMIIESLKKDLLSYSRSVSLN